MLIAFEGIDRAGKSTLSVKFAEYLNNCKIDGLLKLDPHFGDFVWTKEPTFSVEEARVLNSPGYIDEFKREHLFFESRLRHQNYLIAKNIVCERYLWSGLAYAFKYSPNCFRLLKELYIDEKMFVQPDLYIFVDTPASVCLERDLSLDLDTLREVLNAYLQTQEYIRAPVIKIQPVGDEQETLNHIIVLFEDFIKNVLQSNKN